MIDVLGQVVENMVDSELDKLTSPDEILLNVGISVVAGVRIGIVAALTLPELAMPMPPAAGADK